MGETHCDEPPVSADCLATCAPGSPALCERGWCRCACHEQPDHRPADKLYAVADELKRELYDPQALAAERFSTGKAA